MDSDLVISIATPRLPEAVSKGENKKRKQADMDSDLDSNPPVISGDDDDDDDAGFLSGVCTFPFLAVISGRRDTVYELSFIDNKDRKYKMSMPCSNINLQYSLVSSNNGGWIVFVRYDGAVIIFDPATRSQLEDFPPIHRFLPDVHNVYLADNLAAFAAYCTPDLRLLLATAMTGDDKWSVTELPSENHFHRITSIVSHKADGKFYAMDCAGNLLRFGLTRSLKSKTTAVCDPLPISKAAEGAADRYCHPLLVSGGINLLQVRQGFGSKGKFEILMYSPDTEDAWTEMTKVDLGNNSIFIDWYGAKLLPTPPLPPTKDKDGGHEEEKGGRVMRRNCIYSIHYKKIPPFPDQAAEDAARAKYEEERDRYQEETGYVYSYYDFEEVRRETLYNPRARIYDLSQDIVEPCFLTDITSQCFGHYPALMWFMPSSSINN